MPIASGEFDVKLTPLGTHEADPQAALARMGIDKAFRGDLVAASRGEMLSAMGGVNGSAAYVAIERVQGTLGGRRGAFTLQHNATMTRGAPYLNIVVVPDSGNGELTGLSGSMAIAIEQGRHSYRFEYELDGAG